MKGRLGGSRGVLQPARLCYTQIARGGVSFWGFYYLFNGGLIIAGAAG